MGQVSNRQAEPLLHGKDDLHVAYWNVRTLQDVGVQALTMRELRKYNVDIAYLRDRNAYWKAIVEETERAAACGDTRKLYQMLKSVSRRPAGVGEVLLERDGSVIPDQARKLCRWEEHFSVTQHPRTPHSHHYLPPRRNPTLVTLSRPLWRRCALPSDNYAITEPWRRWHPSGGP